MERHRAIYPTSQPTYTTQGTDRELEILDTLQNFDCLLSCCFEGAYSKKLITQLMKGHYIGLPLGKSGEENQDNYGLSQDARLYARLRNVFYPLTVWPRGEALLARRGLWKERRKTSDHFDHKVSRCLYEFSVFKGAKQYGATLESFEDIIRDLKFPEKDNPKHIKVGNETIVPDYTFRLRLKKTFCAHVEIDKATEDLSSTNKDSILSKVKRYAKYIDGGGFNKRYDFPNITVIFVFDKHSRHQAFKEIVRTACKDPEIARRFASMYVPDFRKEYPPLTGYALENDYERVGEPLNILEVIGAENGNQREGTESLRTGAEDKGGRGGNSAPHG